MLAIPYFLPPAARFPFWTIDILSEVSTFCPAARLPLIWYKCLLSLLYNDKENKKRKKHYYRYDVQEVKGGFHIMAKAEMDNAAAEARRAYQREWRKKNRDKVRAIQARYWEKKSREAQAAGQEQEGKA